MIYRSPGTEATGKEMEKCVRSRAIGQDPRKTGETKNKNEADSTGQMEDFPENQQKNHCSS